MSRRLTVDSIFNELIPSYIDENPEIIKRINSTIGVELKGDNIQKWTINLLDNPGIFSDIKNDVKCYIAVDKKTFESLLNENEIKPWLDAYKLKKITVKGHLPTIIKLERLVSGLASKAA